MILTKGEAFLSRIPILMPIGVTTENISRKISIFLKGNSAFCIAILIDIASALLSIKIEIQRFMKGAREFIRPRAIPSNIA